MVIFLAIVAVAWLAVLAVVVALCVTAKQGDVPLAPAVADERADDLAHATRVAA